MALRNVEVVETRWGIIEQAATGCGKVALGAGHNRLPPVFGCRRRRRIAPIHPQRLELRPRRRRDFRLEILPFNQQPIRRDLGQSTARALVSPGAPSVVIVPGVGSPRLPRARSTSRQLS
jgi:hypothetical protein